MFYQNWLRGLKQFCGNTRKKPSSNLQSNLPDLKELRTLYIKVCDARKLPAKLLSHPYCVVSLNDVKVSRTSVKGVCEGSACWDEDFIFE